MRAGERADAATIAALVVAVLAISASGSIAAYAAAPALAIAFWRNAMATGVLAPVAGLRRGGELVRLAGPRRRDLAVCVLAGAALAAHFATWVPATKMTTVATATALGATQPVWQGLIAVGQGRRLARLIWVGIGCAVLGALVATGADVGVSDHGRPRRRAGPARWSGRRRLHRPGRAGPHDDQHDLVHGGLLRRVRGLLLLLLCLVTGTPLTGYPASAWVALVALTVGPQLLGHSLFTYSMRKVTATTVSVLILLEVPGSAVVAWAWLGQLPPPAAWPGLALLLVGVGLVVIAGRRARGAPVLEEPIR